MKKQLQLSLVSAAMLLAVSTASFAHANYKGEVYKGEPPCPSPLMIKDGWYVGVQAGYDSYSIRNNSSVTESGSTLTANPTLNATGFVGGIYGGYGQYFSDYYYLGAEIFANGSAASESWTGTATSGGNTVSYNSKDSVNGSWGISLLPGIKLNNAALLYVRLGYNEARIKGAETVTANGAVVTDTSTSSWRGGFNYGIGSEVAFYQNWSLRGEYTHTNYGSFNSKVTNTSFSPSDNQFMLGLSYHFS